MKATKRRPTVKQKSNGHIVRTPGILGGEPRIKGLRIRVRDIAAARDLGGLSPEQIAATVYPQLTLSQIYYALAYFEEHRDEIQQASADELRFLEEFKRQHPNLVQDCR